VLEAAHIRLIRLKAFQLSARLAGGTAMCAAAHDRKRRWKFLVLGRGVKDDPYALVHIVHLSCLSTSEACARTVRLA
jgi:hypothetical protein